MVSDILWIISRIDLLSLIDILLVALIFYGLLYLMRGTRAIQLIRGIFFLLVAVVLASNLLSLTAFGWLLRNALPALLVAVPVIFQPELRRALERLGRGGGLINRASPERAMMKVTRALAQAARTLSDRRYGALMVLERETGLQEYVDTGVKIEGELSPELLLTIFQPNTALHDGAVVIRGDRVLAAACILPVSESMRLEPYLGLRHRAAVGITEQSDAVAIVVSEETGTISLVRHGRMIRNLDDVRLRKILQSLYRYRPEERGRWFRWREEGG